MNITLLRKLLSLLFFLGIASPSWATIALVSNAIASGATGGTTGSIDTSGATLLIARITASDITGASVSDSKSNTWTPLTSYATSAPDEQIFYVANPTVGTGHTFTVSAGFAVINASAWSGVATTTPFDQENGLSGGGFDGTNGNPGNTTPGEDNELLIYGAAYTDSSNRTVDSGFTILDQVPLAGGLNYGGINTYLIQTTAGTVNPLINLTGGGGVSIATFKAGAGGAPPAVPPLNRFYQRPIFYR